MSFYKQDLQIRKRTLPVQFLETESIIEWWLLGAGERRKWIGLWFMHTKCHYEKVQKILEMDGCTIV